jgi:hypothetical protein
MAKQQDAISLVVPGFKSLDEARKIATLLQATASPCFVLTTTKATLLELLWNRFRIRVFPVI